MKRVAVTGGGGFIGRALVAQLIDKGCSVVVIGRRHYPDLESSEVQCVQVDISDGTGLRQAFQGVDTVFHVAAKAGIWGDPGDYLAINVAGTQRVIDACRYNRVNRLVYTSTPSVVFDGTDIIDGNEELPYADRPLCAYAKTKIAAERMVLTANSNSLKTCAIRPHLVWGPDDPHLIPRLIERGMSGTLRIIGSGSNMVDISYVENVAFAHVLAGENLTHSGSGAGQPYFIGQERPVKLWEWVNEMYRELGIAPITRKVPLLVAYTIGWLLEGVYRLAKIAGEPPMTRFVALQLSRSHYFSHHKAAQELGYRPRISIAEGQDRMLTALKKS
jgi:nucleoside-diphosphate-sugar epimerase